MATPRPRYPASRRWLHWSVALLMVLVYVFVLGREGFERGTAARAAMLQAHFWVGLAILALMLPRLMLAFSRRPPPVTPPLPAWQHVPAVAMHLLLFAMLLAQPVLGLLTAWADGKTILLPFTSVAVPGLLAPDPRLAHSLEEVHEWIGTAFYWVVGLHVAAALYHQFIRRDDTLRRMT